MPEHTPLGRTGETGATGETEEAIKTGEEGRR